MSVSPDTKTQTKCSLMRCLKLDTEEQETKLDRSEFQTSTGFKLIGFSQRNEKLWWRWGGGEGMLDVFCRIL